jgi:hypothetical protein
MTGGRELENICNVNGHYLFESLLDFKIEEHAH